jgi:hypothetical protein
MESDDRPASEPGTKGADPFEQPPQPPLVDRLSTVGEREAEVGAGCALGAELID